jgi:hypothetical protein
MSRARLVFLAGRASTDIVCSKVFHPLAFVRLSEEVRRVRDSGVTRERVIMVQLQYFTSLIEIVGEFGLCEAFGWQ